MGTCTSRFRVGARDGAAGDPHSTGRVQPTKVRNARGSQGSAGSGTGVIVGSTGRHIEGLTRPPSLFNVVGADGAPSYSPPTSPRPVADDVTMENISDGPPSPVPGHNERNSSNQSLHSPVVLRRRKPRSPPLAPLPDDDTTVSCEGMDMHGLLSRHNSANTNGHDSVGDTASALPLLHSKSSYVRASPTKSLQGRFRTKSARLLERRPTIETSRAVVSRDLDSRISSSDEESSDDEQPRQPQQRFVNQ